METKAIDGMCRCCASSGIFKDMYATYNWMGEDEIYANMLQYCFDITLSTAQDQNNGGICEVCITQLRNAANFKKQVQQTEIQFKKLQEEKEFSPKPVKIEISEMTELLDDVINSDNEMSDSDTEFTVNIKQENPEPKAKKRAKATSSRADDTGEPSNKREQHKKISKAKKKSETVKSCITKPIREFKKHQENLRSILKYSNASMIRGKNSDGYSCNFCPKRFPQPRKLKSHFLEDHNDVLNIKLPKLTDCLLKVDITGLKCHLCDRIFVKLDQFTTHLSDHGITIYTDVKNEIIPFKFDTELLKCALCDANFTTFKILQEHMHVHFSNYFCDVCSAGFITKRRLIGHKRRHGIGSFKCGYCEKIFICDSKRRDHEQRIHLGLNKRNKCKFCDDKFADYWTKVDHMVKKHNQPRMVLKCQACERTFENKRTLTRHIKKDHLMERKHMVFY
ncbi:protein suppressor of hairy wing isoform X6 [Papilio machaon]|uniref:protein suppressor of hairy wing isoform X6 n=1 Tax=Papilio machaon TaxID=76193 RepID=UPI0006EB1B5F|nr:protein suppressor of hairy wing isoform X6 [Papilio machaon]